MASMPKRRKSKDNPYTLSIFESKYVVSFKDSKNINYEVEISEQVFKSFNNFELEDISQMHEFERHIEHSDLLESTLNNRAVNKTESIEDEVERKIIIEELRYALDTLSELQKRRIKMYYFEDLNLREIAELEGCSIKNVHKSIEQGLENLRKILKK